jgi:hypothetical protein
LLSNIFMKKICAAGLALGLLAPSGSLAYRAENQVEARKEVYSCPEGKVESDMWSRADQGGISQAFTIYYYFGKERADFLKYDSATRSYTYLSNNVLHHRNTADLCGILRETRN